MSAINLFDIASKTSCLSREFEFGEKSNVESVLSQKGGVPVNRVTKKTNYVIARGN